MCVAFAKVDGLEERLAAHGASNQHSSGSGGGRDMRSARDASLGIVQATLHTAQRAILSSGGALRQFVACQIIADRTGPHPQQHLQPGTTTKSRNNSLNIMNFHEITKHLSYIHVK